MSCQQQHDAELILLNFLAFNLLCYMPRSFRTECNVRCRAYLNRTTKVAPCLGQMLAAIVTGFMLRPACLSPVQTRFALVMKQTNHSLQQYHLCTHLSQKD